MEYGVLVGIWDEFLKIAHEEAGSRVVETWFKAVALKKWDALHNTIYLQAPNSFVKDWIKKNYTSLFQLQLGRLLNVNSPKIVFIDSETFEPAIVSPMQENKVSYSVVPAIIPEKSKVMVPRAQGSRNQSHINANFVFNNFIIGPSNSLAYAAAQAITENPGKLYNPLFIYGGSGLGKTHLLHAIGNEIKQQNKNATILYQTADRFVNEFISAIRFNKVYKFQAKYKDIDVLLIDDVQFISNKEQTQEAFFHIFNSLYDAQKQIVFSSDTFPQNMQGLAERLRSRLASGLVTDIHAPGLETKIAIIKKKAEQSKNIINDEVAHFIASRSVSNIRELEGALIRVMAFASLTKQPINIELARKVLIRVQPQESQTIDFSHVIKIVHKHYGYDLQQLQLKNRNKELAFARQIAMFLMKKLTEKSLRDIGMYLGGRDHSTVMHAIEKIAEQSKSDQNLQARLKTIEEEICS